MADETQNTETTQRKFKSVNGKELSGSERQGNISFVSAGKLAKEGIANQVVAEGVLEKTADVETKFGTKKQYSIRAENGDLIMLDGAGGLDKQMAKVKPGTYIQVTYLGKKKIETGAYKGSLSHSFVVGIAE